MALVERGRNNHVLCYRGAAHKPNHRIAIGVLDPRQKRQARLLKQQSRRPIWKTGGFAFSPNDAGLGQALLGGVDLGPKRPDQTLRKCAPLFDVAECDVRHKNAASETAKPSAARGQRLCLVHRTCRVLGRHPLGCRKQHG